jgi:hypothetical protein
MKYRWLSSGFFFNLPEESYDIIMMKKCMIGIKQRTEKWTA